MMELLISDHLTLWPPTPVSLVTGLMVPLVLPSLGDVKPMEGGVAVIQHVNVSYHMLILAIIHQVCLLQLSTVVPWATPPMEQ